MAIDPVTGVMTALVAAFVFGIGITRINSPTLKAFFDEGKEIIERMIWKIIIPILPFYIASIFAELAADGTVFETLKTFGLVLLLAVILKWVWLFVLYTIAGCFSGLCSLNSLKSMFQDYITGYCTILISSYLLVSF